MIAETVIIDAGPLAALLHESDSRHEECRIQAREIVGPVVTSWAAVAEAAWLLRRFSDGLERLFSAIVDRDIELAHIPQEALPDLEAKAHQFRDLRPQAADLSLVYLADRLHTDCIFTLDVRDFSVYRTSAGNPFRLLPDIR